MGNASFDKEEKSAFEKANLLLQADFINSYPEDSINPEIKNKCDYELTVNLGPLAYDDLLKAGFGAQILKDPVSEAIKNYESSDSRFSKLDSVDRDYGEVKVIRSIGFNMFPNRLMSFKIDYNDFSKTVFVKVPERINGVRSGLLQRYEENPESCKTCKERDFSNA